MASIGERRFGAPFTVLGLVVLASVLFAGCARTRPTSQPELKSDAAPDAGPLSPVVAAPPKARALSPVPLWRDGKISGEFDASQARSTREVVIDLGEQ